MGARTYERQNLDRYQVGMSAAAQTSDHGPGMSRVSRFDQYRSLRTNEPSSTHSQSDGPLFRSEHQFPQSNSQHAELTSDRNTEPVATTVCPSRVDVSYHREVRRIVAGVSS